jgi:TetR/AcrR family transcriptional repressor of nem operon
LSKAVETRDRIIEQAAELFNQRGYAGTSMSDLMAATGLQKGGLYNHFASKDELAIAAFDFAVKLASQRHLKALKGQRSSRDKLQAMVASFTQSFEEMSAWGGCPLMNTAVDSDDTHPQLRAKSQQAIDTWHELLRRITQKGMEAGEFSANTDPDEVATIIIAVLEGALVLARLYRDRVHMDRAHTHLCRYIASLQAGSNTS